jgi:hypothetical protein
MQEQPRRVIVYIDVIEFHGSPPRDDESVALVRGDGPHEGEVMTEDSAVHRRHRSQRTALLAAQLSHPQLQEGK